MYGNQFIYSRERRRFGRQCLFTDRNELMVSVHPSVKLRLKYILRNPIGQGTQLSDTKGYSIVETENVAFEHHGVNHYEGGWPKEVNINDEEQTLRHRKKVERDDEWGIQVNNLIKRCMQVAEQNNAINIYQNFFADIPSEIGADIKMRFEARAVNIFYDVWKPRRRTVKCEWSPSDNRFFLSLLTNDAALNRNYEGLHTDVNDFGSTNAFYMWDIRGPLMPSNYFDGAELVTRAYICPKDDIFMAGGYKSGKVVLWETHNGGLPLRTCPLEAAHREEVSAFCWVHSKSNTEFYTGSLDGSIKYWDARDLKMPIQELLLEPDPQERQFRKNAHGVTVLEFEYTIPVRYIICSDLGYVFVGNRKGMTAPEALLGNYQMFAGPIRTIQRNPFFVKNFLLCGDWRARIWAEESKGSPGTMYFTRRNQIMCGSWSSGRCSVFVTGDSKGFLDFWDMLLNYLNPVYTLRFNVPITDISFRPDGEFLNVSLYNGIVYILELDDALKTASSKEKALVAAMFEREISRCKLLEARIEEIKLKAKKAQEAEEERLRKELAGEFDMDIEIDTGDPDKFVQMIEQDEEFRQALQDFQEAILSVEKKRSNRNFIMERTDFEQFYLDHIGEDLPDERESAFYRSSSVAQPNP